MEKLRQYGAPALALALAMSSGCKNKDEAEPSRDIIEQTKINLLRMLKVEKEGTLEDGSEAACIVTMNGNARRGKRLAEEAALTKLRHGALRRDRRQGLRINTPYAFQNTIQGMVACAVAKNPNSPPEKWSQR